MKKTSGNITQVDPLNTRTDIMLLAFIYSPDIHTHQISLERNERVEFFFT